MAWRRHETRLFRHLTFNFSPILLNCNLDCKSHLLESHRSQFTVLWCSWLACGISWGEHLTNANVIYTKELPNKTKQIEDRNPSMGHEFATMTLACPVHCEVKCPLWVKVRDAVHCWGQRRGALVTEAAWPPAQWPSGDHCHCWVLTRLH